jgi:hypothetical protein
MVTFLRDLWNYQRVVGRTGRKSVENAKLVDATLGNQHFANCAGEHDNLDRGEDIQVSHELPQQVGQRLDPVSRCQLDIPLHIILSHDIPITNTSQYIPSISQVYCIPSISKIPSHYIPAKKWFWVPNGWVVIVYSSLVFHYTDVGFFEMGDPRVTIGFNTKMI